MELEYRLLTDSEIAEGLAQLSGWSVEDRKIAKRYSFKSYKDGLASHWPSDMSQTFWIITPTSKWATPRCASP